MSKNRPNDLRPVPEANAISNMTENQNARCKEHDTGRSTAEQFRISSCRTQFPSGFDVDLEFDLDGLFEALPVHTIMTGKIGRGDVDAERIAARTRHAAVRPIVVDPRRW